MGLKAGLATYLLARSGITALVGTRLGPPPVEQMEKGSTTYPALTFQFISETNVHSLSGASQLAQPRVQITVWDLTWSGVESLRDAVVDALDGYAGAMGSVTVQACLKLDERDLFDDAAMSPGLREARVYGKAIDFQISYTEPAPTFA